MQARELALTAGSAARIYPQLEPALVKQLAFIKYFALQTDNPLHSRWEFEIAACGLGNAGRKVFNRIVKPFLDEIAFFKGRSDSSIAEYRGRTVPGNGDAVSFRLLLGRLNNINDLTRPRHWKINPLIPSAEVAELERERSLLEQRVCSEISLRAGVPAGVLQRMYDDYEEQLGIADVFEMVRLTPTVRRPLRGLMDVVLRIITRLRGGHELIADAAMRRAIWRIAPEPYPDLVKGVGVVGCEQEVSIRPQP